MILIFLILYYAIVQAQPINDNQLGQHRIVKRHAAPDPQPKPQPKGGGNSNFGRISHYHESLEIYHDLRVDKAGIVLTVIAVVLTLVFAIAAILLYWKKTLVGFFC